VHLCVSLCAGAKLWNEKGVLQYKEGNLCDGDGDGDGEKCRRCVGVCV